MAIIGGAGNPVGGSFTGPAQALEIAGDFAYAYNEVGTAQLQSITNTLEFTTGNYLFVGEWTVSGSVNIDGISANGGIDQFYLKLNGSTVMTLRTDTKEEDMPPSLVVPVIIPAYTEVEVSAVCELENDAWVVSNSLTGRIYRENPGL